jgi:hypothetical protein
MARSRNYDYRQIARNAVRFGAPIHITTNDLYDAPLEDEATIHGFIDVIGPYQLHLTQMDGTKKSINWGHMAGIEWTPREATKRRNDLGYK